MPNHFTHPLLVEWEAGCAPETMCYLGSDHRDANPVDMLDTIDALPNPFRADRDRLRALILAELADRSEDWQRFCEWREVESPCPECHGSGVRTYGSTATWRGGIGGAACTSDVCDHCWGSGDEHRHGVDLLAMAAARSAWEEEQCLQYFATRTGATLTVTRKHMAAIAEILERESRRRKTPFDAERGAFWWFRTLAMVSAVLKRFSGGVVDGE